MIEVEKYLFDRMVEYFNGLSKFVTAVGKNELRKASEIRTELQAQKESSKDFFNTIKRKTSSPSSAGSARAMAGFKKPIQDLIKYFDALETGIDNGELNLTKFREQVKTLIKPIKDKLVTHAAKFMPTGVTDEDLNKQVKHASQLRGHKDALSILRNAAKKMAEDEQNTYGEVENEKGSITDAEAEKAVQQFMKYRNKLPSSLKGRQFQIVKMPVVPFTDFRLMTPKFLRKTGLDFQYVASSYVVIENQDLLAFDLGAATEYKGRTVALKQQGLKSRKRAAKHKDMTNNFVIEVINRINELTDGEEYTLVSSHFEHHPHNARIAFAWIMPVRTFRIFERNGNLSSFEWGFPWSREAASIL
jgi:hypothetical protein